MDIRQLRYFIAIANAKNYSIAAKSLFVTQPTLTWTIKKLEDALNTKFFTEEMELTESGRLLYEYGSKIVNDCDNLTKQIRDLQNIVSGSLKVGLTVLSSIQYMQSISEFTSSHPNIDLTLVQKGSKRIQEMVSTGELDVGLVSFPLYYENLEVKPFSIPIPNYEVSLVLSKNNPLASKKVLKIIDLKNEAFCSLSSDYVLGNLIYNRCNEVGFNPNIIFQNDNWEVLLENVAIANSVTLLPKAFSSIAKRDDIQWVKLDDKINKIDIGLIKRKNENLSELGLLFCQAIEKNHYREKVGS